MIGPIAMAAMIHAEHVTDEKRPVGLGHFREEVLLDAVVYGVEITDVERGKRILASEMARKQIGPRVVADEDDGFARGVELREEIVLDDLISVKVCADVDERRQTSGCQTLQPLHRRRRRIGDEFKQFGFGCVGGL